MKIDSNDRTVKQVFQAGYYRVPRFQRPYSWTFANVEDFWTDTIVESAADYFIGSIIVFPSQEDTYDIVDGQQRLTTITILLAALRNAYDSQSLPALASGLHTYIERRDVNNNLRPKPLTHISTNTSRSSANRTRRNPAWASKRRR